MGVLEGLEAVGLAQGLPLGVVGPGLVAVAQRRPGAGDVEWSASTRSCVTVYVVSTRVAVARTTVA